MKYLDVLRRHLPAVVLIVVAVLNILIKDGSINLDNAWADSLNIVLGALGVGVHINNSR